MRIAVAMSGGVDSSVAAAVLKAQGHEVLGLTMKLWACSNGSAEAKAREEELMSKTRGDVCCSPKDVLDAKDVAHALGMPHYVLEMAESFSHLVIDQFIDEYSRGRTPSPCVRCNERVKSKGLVQKAKELGCEALATGHYARIDADPATGRRRLRMGLDPERDQSYFLFPVAQDELTYLRFPVGELPKKEVRAMAADLGLVVADKPDSQEICFVKDNDHRRFLRDKAPQSFVPGPILYEDGREIGRHDGLAGYTVGQRRGLKVAWTEALYVVRLDMERNAVILGPDASLWEHALEAREMHWIAGEAPPEGVRAEAKIRYRGASVPCTLLPKSDGSAEIHFDHAVRAVSPGQAVVLYNGDVCLGGGWIERALKAGRPAAAARA
ncbi:MAG: tRNA 2-thiouridine(34) synthase MnmA [Planctomycetota bacterium]|nr:tRNA 2-thiouridine(34) synthase MnmA [Planctomycetota bacterium]